LGCAERNAAVTDRPLSPRGLDSRIVKFSEGGLKPDSAAAASLSFVLTLASKHRMAITTHSLSVAL
jgi:hypothetical protein